MEGEVKEEEGRAVVVKEEGREGGGERKGKKEEQGERGVKEVEREVEREEGREEEREEGKEEEGKEEKKEEEGRVEDTQVCILCIRRKGLDLSALLYTDWLHFREHLPILSRNTTIRKSNLDDHNTAEEVILWYMFWNMLQTMDHALENNRWRGEWIRQM